MLPATTASEGQRVWPVRLPHNTAGMADSTRNSDVLLISQHVLNAIALCHRPPYRLVSRFPPHASFFVFVQLICISAENHCIAIATHCHC